MNITVDQLYEALTKRGIKTTMFPFSDNTPLPYRMMTDGSLGLKEIVDTVNDIVKQKAQACDPVLIEKAREKFSADDVMIDDDAAIEHINGGYWVSAFVLVRK